MRSAAPNVFDTQKKCVHTRSEFVSDSVHVCLYLSHIHTHASALLVKNFRICDMVCRSEGNLFSKAMNQQQKKQMSLVDGTLFEIAI